MTTKKQANKKAVKAKGKRKYLSQSDVPGHPLDQALRIPRAISDNYAGEPVTPLRLASALDMAPNSSYFRQLCGASIAYGLTEGGYNAQTISLTQLGKRIVKSLEEGDDLVAKREAILKPRVLGEFLQKYNNSPLPRNDIALNVLEDLGVPSNKTESVYTLILDSAESVGLIREIKGKQYIDLTGVDISSNENIEEIECDDENKSEQEQPDLEETNKQDTQIEKAN